MSKRSDRQETQRDVAEVESGLRGRGGEAPRRRPTRRGDTPRTVAPAGERAARVARGDRAAQGAGKARVQVERQARDGRAAQGQVAARPQGQAAAKPQGRAAAKPQDQAAANAQVQTRAQKVRHARPQVEPAHEVPASTPTSTRRVHRLTTAVTFGMIAIGAVLGLALFARPTVSEAEKRELTHFPELSAQSVTDGSFFSGLSLWYSDTFPFRDQLVSANEAVQSTFGVKGETQMVGGNVQQDDLDAALQEEQSGADSGDQAEEEPQGPVEVPDQNAMAADMQANVMKGLYVKDGAAYSVYYFVQDAVDRYAEAMNTCATNLDGQAEVYSILIPNNSGAVLDQETLDSLGGTDPKKALEYWWSKMDSDKVHVVKSFDNIRAHRDEYIYFRTDHHWTQLGAYYAYEEFCKEKGVEPADINSWELQTFKPFLGSFYSQLHNSDMAANPDYVDARIPPDTNDMTIWNRDGEEVKGHVITDVSSWNENSKYVTFIAGDQPLEKIENPKKDDGSSCLLIKESYGDAFAPMLVANYQTVWIMDFRYNDSNIIDFVKEHDVKDVIFLNNMTMAGSESVSKMIWNKVQQP